MLTSQSGASTISWRAPIKFFPFKKYSLALVLFLLINIRIDFSISLTLNLYSCKTRNSTIQKRKPDLGVGDWFSGFGKLKIMIFPKFPNK